MGTCDRPQASLDECAKRVVRTRARANRPLGPVRGSTLRFRMASSAPSMRARAGRACPTDGRTPVRVRFADPANSNDDAYIEERSSIPRYRESAGQLGELGSKGCCAPLRPCASCGVRDPSRAYFMGSDFTACLTTTGEVMQGSSRGGQCHHRPEFIHATEDDNPCNASEGPLLQTTWYETRPRAKPERTVPPLLLTHSKPRQCRPPPSSRSTRPPPTPN